MLRPILVTAILAAGGTTTPERPNVIIILTDTVRADRLGAYGNRRNTSPVFDAFSRRGLLFLNAYAPSPWTRPSVASLFTGRYPQRHGVQMRQDALPESLPTLARILRDRGMQTAMVTTNPHVTETWGMTRGFDRVIELMPDPDKLKSRNNARVVYRRVHELAAELSEPFFLYVHLIDPHYPYEPPEHDLKALRLAPDSASSRARYDAEIRFADRWVGRMMQSLEARGLLERSIVVLTSDHGEEFGEHGSTGHGKTVYQEVVRVPLAMQLPSLAGRLAEPRCRMVEANVSLVDLMPTILGILEIPPPANVDGEDLAPLLDCGQLASRPIFFSVEKEQASHAGILLEHNKLVVDRATGRRQLFVLEEDPREQGIGRGASTEMEPMAAYLASTLELFEWSAKPGVHLELAGKEGDRHRQHMVVRVKTNGRFVAVETRGFEAKDKFRMSHDRSFIRIDAHLTSFWHRSPKHTWAQDRDELSFELEPPDAEVAISVRIDGERAHTAIVRFPTSESRRWPLTFSRTMLAGNGQPSLVDRRRFGVYLYAQESQHVEKVETLSQDMAASLKALGYIQ